MSLYRDPFDGFQPPAALVVIDVQRGAINKHTEHIPGRLATFLGRNESRFELTVATRFVNRADSPVRLLLQSNAFIAAPDTDLCESIQRTGIRTLTKDRYSAVDDGLLAELATRRIRNVYLTGLDTDMCVLHTAIDLFEVGIVPWVLSELCASTGGPSAHEAGLLILRRSIGKTHVV